MTKDELLALADRVEAMDGPDRSSCAGCVHERLGWCLRDLKEPPYRQAYEIKYDDDDYCGPKRRYYQPKPRSLLRRLTACLRAHAEAL